MMPIVRVGRYASAGRRASVVAGILTVLAACAGDAVHAPMAPVDALLAKGGGNVSGPVVASANPSYAQRGEVSKQVTITGSGFAAGAIASWERNGVPDPKITVLSTQFVSSTQLVATITVAGDADLALYDIAVTNPDRKKGIGTSKFEVTTAEVLGSLGGNSYVNDMGADGTIAGYCTGSGACTGSFAFVEGSGLVALGAGQGWATDPLGTMVLGRDGSSRATAWVWQAGGGYVGELLPSLYGVGGNAAAAARNASGTLIVAGWDQQKLSRNDNANRPSVWTRVGSTWTGPVIWSYPGTRASISDINGAGQGVGRWDNSKGLVWESATQYVTLDGIPQSINESGSLAVGERAGLPVFWARSAATGAWNPVGYPLPSIFGTTCSVGSAMANDVNDAGIIVGSSCNGSKAQATVWRVDLSGGTPVLVGGAQGLPGIGATGTDKTTTAVSISNSAPYVIAGHAVASQSVVVRWPLPE